VALGHGVPVVLVTGDATTAEEARRICPGIQAAVVKQSVSRFAAESLHPAEACELIRDRAAAAVADLGAASLPRVRLPATLEVSLRHSDLAEMATRVAGVRRLDTLTVQLVDEDPIRLYQRFITVVLLTRGMAE